MTERVIHDADSHIMEPPDLFASFADPEVRERVEALAKRTGLPGDHDATRIVEHFRRKHAEPEFRAEDEERVWLRKNWEATGSFIAADRPPVLDWLGVSSQLVFNTFTNKTLQRVEHGDDLDLAYGLAAGAQPRDRRLLRRRRAAAAGRLRAARRRRPGRRHSPSEALDAGVRGADDRLGVPARALAQPRRSRSRVGPAQEARHPDRVPRRRRRAACSIPRTSRTACRRSPTSTAATTTSARSTTSRSSTR